MIVNKCNLRGSLVRDMTESEEGLNHGAGVELGGQRKDLLQVRGNSI